MKQAAAPTTHSPHGKKPSTLSTIGTDLLDTAWRIAVPVIAMAVLGILADRKWGTKPWMTLLAVVTGFVISGWLVKRQLAVLEEREDRA
jgi:F0F1-type ATP synthase assembly protein I